MRRKRKWIRPPRKKGRASKRKIRHQCRPVEMAGLAIIKRENGGKRMAEQSLKNHGKRVPVFHFFAVPVFVANFIWSLFRLKQLEISFAGIFGVIFAAALLVVVSKRACLPSRYRTASSGLRSGCAMPK